MEVVTVVPDVTASLVWQARTGATDATDAMAATELVVPRETRVTLVVRVLLVSPAPVGARETKATLVLEALAGQRAHRAHAAKRAPTARTACR